MSREFKLRKNLQPRKSEGSPQILIKPSFRELWNSKLSGLRLFDNMTIIH